MTLRPVARHMRWVQVSICLLTVRIGVLTVIFCLLSVLITSCGERIEPPEPTRITFVHLNTDTAYYESLVEEFSTHYPHITVELRPKSWQLLASGSTADDVDVSLFIPVALCPLYPGRCSASPDELYAQGGVLSLNPFIAQDK